MIERVRFLILLPAAALIFAGSRKEQIRINFPHNIHAANGLACIDCHAAETSSLSTDNLLPSSQICYTCHEKETTPCTFCHPGATENVQALRIIDHISKFPHNRHLAKGIECSVCHQGIEQSGAERGGYLPNMALCQSCHPPAGQKEYCLLCHAAGERLAPADHRLDWRKAHGAASQIQTESCRACHLENDCLRCHAEDNLNREVHPLNYLRIHAGEARAKRDACLTCHDELASCAACHREQMVMPRSHNAVGWSNRRTGGRHGRQGRLDPESCLACHNGRTGEAVCAQCHGPAPER